MCCVNCAAEQSQHYQVSSEQKLHESLIVIKSFKPTNRFSIGWTNSSAGQTVHDFQPKKLSDGKLSDEKLHDHRAPADTNMSENRLKWKIIRQRSKPTAPAPPRLGHDWTFSRGWLSSIQDRVLTISPNDHFATDGARRSRWLIRTLRDGTDEIQNSRNE